MDKIENCILSNNKYDVMKYIAIQKYQELKKSGVPTATYYNIPVEHI